MANHSTPHLGKPRIPTWERRRQPARWRWNGNRRGDPRLPRLSSNREANPLRVICYALAGSLVGLSLLILALA